MIDFTKTAILFKLILSPFLGLLLDRSDEWDDFIEPRKRYHEGPERNPKHWKGTTPGHLTLTHIHYSIHLANTYQTRYSIECESNTTWEEETVPTIMEEKTISPNYYEFVGKVLQTVSPIPVSDPRDIQYILQPKV